MKYGNMIDLTNLHSPTTRETKDLLKTAKNEQCYGICINSECIDIANKYRDKSVKIITVAGFPPVNAFRYFSKCNNKSPLVLYLGLYSKSELYRLNTIIDSDLTDELDLVFPMMLYTKGKLLRITKFLSGITKRYNKPVKVICELGTIFQRAEPLYEIYSILNDSGVSFFKTNTGLIKQDFNQLVQSIQTLNMVVKDFGITKLQLKASGGIRTESQIETLINLGVNRIGMSTIPTRGDNNVSK